MTPNTRRESASLILAKYEKAFDNEATTSFDYKLLMIKRSENTAVTPNLSVFPGGIFESADESIEWLNYLEEFGVTQQSLKQLLVHNDHRPRILAPQGTGCYDRFFRRTQIWAREISLRINAIRETFEEVGVLLCRNKQQLNDIADTGRGCFLNDFDKIYWQQTVHNDAAEFLRLCRTLQVVPDLWGLHEWSAWASPAPFKKGNETVFFITHLTATPHLLAEATEVAECMWQTPEQFLQMYNKGALMFFPPQLYELSRLMNVKSFEKLVQFNQARNLKGITINLPVGYLCTDGMVSCLPGDDFYLADPNSQKEFFAVDVTMAEFRARAKRVHRSEGASFQNITLYLNFELPDGHLSPIAALVGRSRL